MDKPFRVTEPRGKAAARDGQGRKCCRDCGRWLREAEFARHPRTTDGLRAHCRACNVVQRINYVYKMTPEDFRSRLQDQFGACAICGTTDPVRHWCIDHDHSCCPTNSGRTCGGCVRGIICDPCNNGLGRFDDSPERLRAAADYLEAWQNRMA